MHTEPTSTPQKQQKSMYVTVFVGAVIAFFLAHYLYDFTKETLASIHSNSSELVALRDRIAALEKSAVKPSQLLPSPIGEGLLRLPIEGPLPASIVSPNPQSGATSRKQHGSGEPEVKAVSMLNDKKSTQDAIPEPGRFVLLGEDKSPSMQKSVVSVSGQEAAIKLIDKK